MTRRGFWDYRESDGTVTNLRRKWFVGAVLVTTLIGTACAFIGGLAIWWPTIVGAAAVGAVGTLIAFTIDYVHDRPRDGGA